MHVVGGRSPVWPRFAFPGTQEGDSMVKRPLKSDSLPSIRIDPELRRRLAEAAAVADCSQGQLVRQAIRAYLDAQAADGAKRAGR